jgi:hypothetical protein
MFGVANLEKALKSLIVEAKKSDEAWCGSTVEYGPFHEFGTERMQARPHWRAAIAKLDAEVAFKSEEYLAILAKPGQSMAFALALRLERLVKLEILRLGIVDTGNYRGSVAADERLSQAIAISNARRTDR